MRVGGAPCHCLCLFLWLAVTGCASSVAESGTVGPVAVFVFCDELSVDLAGVDVACFPFALWPPFVAALLECESAAWAGVVGVVVCGCYGLSGSGLVCAPVVWPFNVAHRVVAPGLVWVARRESVTRF